MAGEPVLVVDDNAANLKLARVVLAGAGYEVHTAGDAREALAVLERVQPSVILVDLQMPGIDGFELARMLKADARRRDVPIVALTAYAMKGDEERARAAGCDGYIAKPIDTRTLPGTVARFIGRPARGGREPSA